MNLIVGCLSQLCQLAHAGTCMPAQTESKLMHRAGYFQGANANGEWVGLDGISVGRHPEFGRKLVHPRHGIATIGAVPWIVNYNILASGLDMAAGAGTGATYLAANGT
jgi:hypothetical protein